MHVGTKFRALWIIVSVFVLVLVIGWAAHFKTVQT
jgi:hypothetical protein